MTFLFLRHFEFQDSMRTTKKQTTQRTTTNCGLLLEFRSNIAYVHQNGAVVNFSNSLMIVNSASVYKLPTRIQPSKKNPGSPKMFDHQKKISRITKPTISAIIIVHTRSKFNFQIIIQS